MSNIPITPPTAGTPPENPPIASPQPPIMSPTPFMPSATQSIKPAPPSTFKAATQTLPQVMQIKPQASYLLPVVGIAALFIFAIILLNQGSDNNRPFAWLAVIGVVVLATALFSKLSTGFWKGALVDERNRISLSRFQLVLWTILIISGIATAILSNVVKHSQEGSALAVNIPPELLALMGISTTSLVGSPLFRSAKLSQTPDPAQQDNTLDQLAQQGIDPTTLGNHGQLLVNASPKDARWSDLIRGEETSNAAQFDLARIQMLYFTVLLVVGYGGALAAAFLANGLFAAFPKIDQSMVLLLGISHAGYLTSKAVPR